MKIIKIGDKEYFYSNDIRENNEVRNSFNKLALETFDLSFDGWYQSGFWNENYRPFVLLDGTRVVANVSANILDFDIKEERKKTVQIGTVMCDHDYRNQGLVRYLMDRVIETFETSMDAIYLYANGSVLEFYEKFGFKPALEYHQTFQTYPLISTFKHVVLDPRTIASLQSAFEQGNAMSSARMKNNFDLVMFYCTGPFNNSVYYSEVHNCFAIYEDGVLYDLYGKDADLKTILHELGNGTSITLGFMAEGLLEPVTAVLEEDTYLFVYNKLENIFAEPLLLPLLSHA
ncbi:GNAT family N-acetyltransferase [Erysipelothrix sp. HDW6C]|uniref:GNAT family N-acetyltransferase n=1 Tax=Erysipelothrix sp. HDW6C TaxID=2714930 RepID=UPI00140C1BDD|nr:GNAT family N-acetyltransferase [Erysipelothrix sp. HDW6C]QIK69576.1 GNAT family N-acetyltransferase [Erysipelothrix sp. HDW6C]